MFLQESVPLKAACAWKRVACVPPPMAVSQSLPVVLDSVFLCLSRGGRDVFQLQEQEHPCIFPFHYACGGLQSPNLLDLSSWPFLPCFLPTCRNPTVLHGRADPFSQLSIHHMPSWSNQLLAHCPSLPLHGQPDQGRSCPSPLWVSCFQLFPARAGRCQSTECTSEGPQGLAGIKPGS